MPSSVERFSPPRWKDLRNGPSLENKESVFRGVADASSACSSTLPRNDGNRQSYLSSDNFPEDSNRRIKLGRRYIVGSSEGKISSNEVGVFGAALSRTSGVGRCGIMSASARVASISAVGALIE